MAEISSEVPRAATGSVSARERADDIAVVVVVAGDRALMLRRSDLAEVMWTFPGGKIEPGEPAQSAALRELREEVGIDCKIDKSLGVRLHPITGKNVRYFLCRSDEQRGQIVERDKFDRIAWMSLKDMPPEVKQSLDRRVERELKKLSAAHVTSPGR